ncbi:MAG: oligopeptide ABC transporter permease OppB [Chitinivibrionales bacterium]|nr:oligopeptide ABC transporter permease OppB [Chitinivibrionales bacterium]
MISFIIRRVIETIPTLLIIATVTFFMVRLAPGGPFSSEKSVSPEVLENLNEHYGLDKPITTQYVNYLANILKGNLGPSFKYPNRTVNELIGNSFPVSMQLGLLALIFALFLGLSAGIIASLRSNSMADYVPMTFAMVGICIPTFVVGPLLALLFGLKLGWVNVSGWYSFSDRILPAITLGLPYAAYIARLSRSGMLEILPQDFIRTARAKGVPEWKIILKHALKGGLLPVVSFLGPATAGIITGSFVVETIFQVPGLGRHFINAAFNRDYTMVPGIALFYGSLMIVFNMLVDITYAWLNPRIRLGE